MRAVEAASEPVVLVVHSATGFSGYAASDRVPDRIAAMVYVDTAPGKGALDPEFEGDEKPMVWSEIEEEENLDGLSEEQKERFRERAVPVPASLLRESVELTNDARRDIPSTLICTGFSAEQYQTYAREHPEWAFLAGIPELRNATLDRPADEPLADVVAARRGGRDHRRRREGARRQRRLTEGAYWRRPVDWTNSRKPMSPGDAPASVRRTAASLNCWVPWLTRCMT